MSTLSSSIAQPRTARAPFERLGRFARTPKGLLLGIFLPTAALAGTSIGWGVAWPHLLAAVLGACLVDLINARGAGRARTWPSSALLSGLIVAFILAPETPRLATALVGALASLSQYLLRTRRGHLFNPAALALLAAIPLFGVGQSWWGALPDLPWPWFLLLLVSGTVLVDRLDKFPLVLSFSGCYFGLFAIVALANPARVAEMFRAPFVEAALFLALFMLTDPPTAPSRYVDQIWIGALVATTGCVAQLLGAGQAYLLIGLLAGNLALAARRVLARRQQARELAEGRRALPTPRGSIPSEEL